MSDFNEFDLQGSVPSRDSGSIISHAFDIYKGIFLYAIIAVIVYFVVDFIIQLFTGINIWSLATKYDDFENISTSLTPYLNGESTAYSTISNVVGILLSPLYVGVIYIANKFNSKTQIEITDLFIGYKQNFLQIVLFTFLTEIILIIATLICVIPVFFVFPLLLIGYPILLFENATAIDAMKKSFEIAKENYGVFLGVGLLGLLISISGIVACCIGIIVTMPFIIVVMYSTYCAYLGKPRQLN